MDEVDIENVEELNELEARLYAQIHHEATDVPIDEIVEKPLESENQKIDATAKNSADIGNKQNYETSYHTSKILSKRYWASGENPLKQQHQENNKHRFIRNPFNASNNETNQQMEDNASSAFNKAYNQNQSAKQNERKACNLRQTYAETTNDNLNAQKNNTISNKTNFENPNTSNTEQTFNNSIAPTQTIERTAKEKVAPTSNENKKSKNTDQNIKQKSTPTVEKSNLKLNPVADWMKRNKPQGVSKKLNNKNNKNMQINVSSLSSRNSKEVGPFGKQHQKLQKAKRLEDKRQKSKKAKTTAAAMTNKMEPTEIINLDSNSESDSSDVIMVPIPPPPTFIVEDSGDEEDKNNVPIILGHEENALDSTDVQMSATSSSFIKPQQISMQMSSENMEEVGEVRLENSSRCTSPCSIQSSDDFIGQNDRSRLLTGASGMADDEDLLVLTSDINSLLETPKTLTQNAENENKSDNEVRQQQLNVELTHKNVETSDTLEFATPKTSKCQERSKEDYRVDEGEFRALDVYESESDITDSVYSKGASKPTVIRQIDTSSDDVEDIGSTCSQRTKRLLKRRASSSNRESDACIENVSSSSDEENEDNDDNKLLRTPISFIARGPAVERSKPRKRSRTLSTCSPIAQKKSVKNKDLPGHMSDNEFLATLNNLAQGQEEEDNLEMEGDDSESENIPTARDMAEKILAQHGKEMDAKKTIEDIAIPDSIISKLDKIFESIDEMSSAEKGKTQTSTSINDAVNISDSSDSDIEKRITYHSVPNADTQIIKICPDSSNTENSPFKTRTENGSPIYNVVYSRGQILRGGLGWNAEMRRFYNDSWNGENFVLHNVLRKMNPDKNLWKIYTEDRYNIKLRRHNNLKCTNCCEFGHMRSKCKRPRKPLICYMCGESGHQEPRCPNTICLRCGAKTQVFTKSCNSCTYQNRLMCPICKIRGHVLDYCPDKWRRYHSTIEPNVNPNNSVNYNPRKYCCICGARGHLSDNCRSAVRFMEYPAIVSTIRSHQKSYGDVPIKVPHNGIGLNLMYEPCQEYDFDLVKRTSLDKYYGRFLKAVGLDFMFKRKPQLETTVSTEAADTSAKKASRLSKKYVANPYSRIGTANQQDKDAPNQVQEITESGNCTDNETNDEPVVVNDVINVEDNASVSGVELIGSTVNENTENIQLNTINERPTLFEHGAENFKSPKDLSSSNIASTSKNHAEPPAALDSDSNYSFSEHFDVSSQTVDIETASKESQIEKPIEEESSSHPEARTMEALPDFIPLIDSTANDNIIDGNNDDESTVAGISRRFVAAETDEEMDEEECSRRPENPLPELPCEAKIYLNHSHSKYLLSPAGNAFLVKTSRNHKLKARLDFTSVGHVLVIFGLPSNQDKFQRELLLKYRELADENNQKQSQSNLNVPKRTDVLIRFLRDNITQLLNNLGNVNHLLKRLQFLERQQSKSGYKLAEKVRRSLNMILVGQAGLKDGTMHLDKLLTSLKTLMNDYKNDDVTPPQLRSEITDHWKVIFSSYRHENYQQLVDAYNKLISKNRMPKLIIDPILLGQKVLDTSLSEEQKQKFDQVRTPIPAANESTNAEPAPKQIVPNPLNQKNAKKRKQNSGANTPNSRSNSPNKTLQTTPASVRAHNSSSPTNFKSTLSTTPLKTKMQGNSSTPIKTKTSNSTTSIANKAVTPTIISKKQTQKIMPPPPFANPDKRSNVSTTIQKVSDKWKSTCDTLLMEISSDKPLTTKHMNDGRLRDSKQPSTFWSRESIRYLDDCVRLASAKKDVMEKLKRVQNKAKNGQLSYNDYLAVIKLHTALCGK